MIAAWVGAANVVLAAFAAGWLVHAWRYPDVPVAPDLRAGHAVLRFTERVHVVLGRGPNGPARIAVPVDGVFTAESRPIPGVALVAVIHAVGTPSGADDGSHGTMGAREESPETGEDHVHGDACESCLPTDWDAWLATLDAEGE